MTALRVFSERLLLLVLLLSRIVFLAFGLAVLGATFALGGFLKAENASAAILAAWGWIRATGGLFVAAAVLLFVVRNWIHIPRTGAPEAKAPLWLALVALCLAAQAAVAIFASSGIQSLWQDAIPALDRAGVFREARSGAQGGVILAPVLAVLFVPILETAAAASLIGPPLLLLVLIVTRSRALPKSLVLTALVQGALVAGCYLAMNAFLPMAQALLAATARASDIPAEVQQALAGLRRIAALIGPTAHSFALLLVPIAIWIPFMMFSRRMEGTFHAGSFERARVTKAHPSGPEESRLTSAASSI